jgi:hypothetical protein
MEQPDILEQGYLNEKRRNNHGPLGHDFVISAHPVSVHWKPRRTSVSVTRSDIAARGDRAEVLHADDRFLIRLRLSEIREHYETNESSSG